MTVNELQEALIREIGHITEDMEIYDKNGNRAKLKGYPQAIPILPIYGQYEGEQEGELFPYFTVMVTNVIYSNPEAEERNTASIIILFGIYDEDQGMKGYYTLSSIMQRVITRFMKNQIMDLFYCDKKMAMEFQEDDTSPQFFGGIEMIWYLPDIETEETY